PRHLVVVLGLNVGETGNVGEIVKHGEFVIVKDWDSWGNWSGLVFEVMEFTDDGVFGLVDDDELGI
ncbi:hypothetical protein Tco_1239329, partial [Tanacetum coccineum]